MDRALQGVAKWVFYLTIVFIYFSFLEFLNRLPYNSYLN